MRTWHPISKLTIGLGVAGLGLLWWTEDRVATSGEDQAFAAVSANRLAPESLPGNAEPARDQGLRDRLLPPVERFSAMVERPLFMADRRPLEAPMTMAAAPVADWQPEPAAGPGRPSVRFIGSIEEDGAVRALVGDGFSVRGLSVGQEIEGWTVIAIDARRLILGFDEERLELTILE